MIFIRYECRPLKKHPDYDQIGDGSVNCWIRVRSFAEAKELAEKDIRSQHWKILELEEIWKIPSGHFQTESDGRQYFEQALIDREVFVFHTCPKFPVYCVEFEAVPMKKNTDFPQETIADVKYWVANEMISSTDYLDNFWSKPQHLEKAVSLGKKMIRSEGWKVTEVRNGEPVNHLSFRKNSLLTQCYGEAEEYGECLAFWMDELNGGLLF